MTRLFLRVVAVLALALATRPALAQWKVGGALGFEHESSWDEFLVLTFEGRKPIGQRSGELAPRLSYFLREGETRLQVDVNALYRLILANSLPVEPYMGIGGALELYSFSGGGGSETFVGINYVFGAVKKSPGKLDWYGQFQYTVLHDAFNTALLNFGGLYKLGGPASASRRR